MALRWNEGKSAHGYGKRKSPRPGGGQNASMPPSKWTCPRERTPATANTSCRPAAPLQTPTRRVSKATNGVTPGPLHSRRRVVQGIQRPRCATRGIPAPRCRARPAHNAAQSRPQRRRARATPPIAPSMRPIRVPKNRNTPKIATFLRNGSSQRSNSCERHVCLQCQSGRAAARNHSASTTQALMPSPLAKIPR